MPGIIGDHAQRPPRHPQETGDHPLPVAAPQLDEAADVGQRGDDAADVVDAQAVLRDQVTQAALVGAVAGPRASLEVGQKLSRHPRRLGLIGDEQVKTAIRELLTRWPDVLRREDPKAAAFDHRRAAHADIGALDADGDVRAAEEGGVARKAAPGGDCDPRRHAGHPGEGREAGRIQRRGDQRPAIDIPGAPPAPFCEPDDGHLPMLSKFKHPVSFLVIEVALRARQHCVVIGQHRAARRFLVEQVAVHQPITRRHAVRGRVPVQILPGAPALLRRDGQRADLLEGAGVQHRRDVLPRRPHAERVSLGDGGRSCRILRQRQSVA